MASRPHEQHRPASIVPSVCRWVRVLTVILVIVLDAGLGGIARAESFSNTVWQRTFDAKIGRLFVPGAYFGGFSYSAPALADLDGDGDQDLVIGDAFGELTLFPNAGNALHAVWGAPLQLGVPSVDLASTPAVADVNGDGVADLIVGGMDGTLTYYANTGTVAAAAWAAPATNFLGIDVGSYSMPALVDIDGDGDKDLFVGGGNGLWFIRNTRTTNGLTWATAVTNYAGLKVPTGSAPAFVDLDHDRDMDLLLGNSEGTLWQYPNTGSATQAVWGVVTTNYAAIDVGYDSTPVCADLDGDGDFDLYSGERDGNVNACENRGTETSPSFAPPDDRFLGIDHGFWSKPALGDLNGDRALELLIGLADGSLVYYENIGTPAAPVWQTPVTNYAGANVPSYSAPSLGDVDGDRDLDLVIGNADGTLWCYENTGTTARAAWVRVSTNYAGCRVSGLGSPALADVDGDGDPDLVVGSMDGTLTYFCNTGTATRAMWSAGLTNAWGVNVGADSSPTIADIDEDGDVDLLVGSDWWIYCYENTGTVSFALDPLPWLCGQFEVGIDSAPALADLDGDGDMDVLIGE